MLISLIIGILLIGTIVGIFMNNVETAEYEIIKSQENIETRIYKPMIIAEVYINGQRKESMGDGFRLLADYIFGNNIMKQKISMTAPVQQEFSSNIWHISFIIPSKYNIKNAPKPSDERIKIKEIPSKQFVAIRFSGENSDENVKIHENKLIAYVKRNEIQVIGNAKYAFYNPPWTIPAMRRNEVMLEVKKQSNCTNLITRHSSLNTPKL